VNGVLSRSLWHEEPSTSSPSTSSPSTSSL